MESYDDVSSILAMVSMMADTGPFQREGEEGTSRCSAAMVLKGPLQ